ncbi:MAG: DUF4307 domain-containing protein [Actinomycetota bacterium]|nr:DUF4307 domain-containing protein [Actinomycetota bacterium]
MSQPPTPAYPAPTPEQQARLAERYGPGRRTPVGLLVSLGILVAAFLGWVVWAGLQQADQDVRWRTVGYRDASDTQVVVEFDVFGQPGRRVSCVVRALDARGNEVGYAEVPVTPDASDAHVVYALPVTSRPISAEVVRCAAADG